MITKLQGFGKGPLRESLSFINFAVNCSWLPHQTKKKKRDLIILKEQDFSEGQNGIVGVRWVGSSRNAAVPGKGSCGSWCGGGSPAPS